MGNAASRRESPVERAPSAIDIIPSPEVWENIFRFLPVPTLVAMSRVCRFFAQMRWPIVVVEGGSNHKIDEQVLKLILGKRPLELRISNCDRLGNLGPAMLISCPTIQRLRIQNVAFTAAGVEHLARGFLSLYGSLQEFSLRGCNLNDEAAAVIGECLAEARARRLSVVTLTDNRITAAGLAPLLRALRHIPLARLNLSGNPLHEPGAALLARFLEASTGLEVLHLDQAGLGNAGFEHIMKALEKNRSLRELHCGENGIDHRGMHCMGTAMLENTTLEHLDLQSNTIESEGAMLVASSLKRNRTLKVLNLWDNRIGCPGVKYLAGMLAVNTSLQSLILKFNGFGPAGVLALAEALCVNHTLQRLSLSFCGVGDIGADALSQALQVNTSILALDLEDSDVGDMGACKLGEALRRNKTLHQLHLQCNRIGDVGATGLAAGLAANGSLCDLDLRGSPKSAIGPSGAGKLAEALRANAALRTLNLERNALSKEHLALFPAGPCDVRLVRKQLGALVKSRRKNRGMRFLASLLQ